MQDIQYVTPNGSQPTGSNSRADIAEDNVNCVTWEVCAVISPVELGQRHCGGLCVSSCSRCYLKLSVHMVTTNHRLLLKWEVIKIKCLLAKPVGQAWWLKSVIPAPGMLGLGGLNRSWKPALALEKVSGQPKVE